jgi:hypothetical protein
MGQIRIEHRLGVAAPAEVIWEVVSDLARWGEWNPAYSKAEGRLTIGAPISLDATFPGLKPHRYEGSIVDWVPDTQLLWQGKLGFMARSMRYVEIEKLSDVGCILANGEIIDGFGTRYISRQRKSGAYRAFEAMDEAIKTRAEAMWQARSKTPTSGA